MDKKAVMTFGRFQPPTIGHEKMVHAVHREAQKQGASAHVVVSHSHDKKNNPIHPAHKTHYVKKIAPAGVNVSTSSKSHPTILHHASKLYDQGHTHLTVVVGSDRVKHMHTLLHKYNGKKSTHGHYNFKSIEVKSAGDRDPDADGTSGISGSKMREYAKNKDHANFKKGLPKALHGDHKKIMRKLTEEPESTFHLQYNPSPRYISRRLERANIRRRSAAPDKVKPNKAKPMTKKELEKMKKEDLELEQLTDVQLWAFLEDWQDENDQIDEVLSIMQRRKRAINMRRLRPKLKRMRKIRAKRMADPEKLKVRSQKAARSLLRQRLAGQKGKNYAGLSAAEKMSIDKKLESKKGILGRISQRLLPMVRKKEMERLKKARAPKKEGVIWDIADQIVEARIKDTVNLGVEPNVNKKDRRKLKDLENGGRGYKNKYEDSQVDELSRGTLKSYAKKAKRDMEAHRSYDYQEPDDWKKNNDRRAKRLTGIYLAKKRYSAPNTYGGSSTPIQAEYDPMDESMEKKLGRRAAGSYGRPKTPKQKRAAAKAVRRMTQAYDKDGKLVGNYPSSDLAKKLKPASRGHTYKSEEAVDEGRRALPPGFKNKGWSRNVTGKVPQTWTSHSSEKLKADMEKDRKAGNPIWRAKHKELQSRNEALEEGRGRPRKDAKATEGDRENIIMQLRKSVSLNGKHTVHFKNGDKANVHPQHARTALSQFASHRSSLDKGNYMNHIDSSHENFKSAVGGKAVPKRKDTSRVRPDIDIRRYAKEEAEPLEEKAWIKKAANAIRRKYHAHKKVDSMTMGILSDAHKDVYGFRPRRGQHDHIKTVADAHKQLDQYSKQIRADIEHERKDGAAEKAAQSKRHWGPKNASAPTAMGAAFAKAKAKSRNEAVTHSAKADPLMRTPRFGKKRMDEDRELTGLYQIIQEMDRHGVAGTLRQMSDDQIHQMKRDFSGTKHVISQRIVRDLNREIQRRRQGVKAEDATGQGFGTMRYDMEPVNPKFVKGKGGKVRKEGNTRRQHKILGVEGKYSLNTPDDFPDKKYQKVRHGHALTQRTSHVSEVVDIDHVKQKHRREDESMRKRQAREIEANRRHRARSNIRRARLNMGEKMQESLKQKAWKSGIPLSILEKVFDRGVQESTGKDKYNNGFNRVNSYIAGGQARDLDDDLQ